MSTQDATLPLPDERDSFEAWIKKDGGDLSMFGSGANLHYKNSAVNNAWIGWKTRAAIAAQARPPGFSPMWFAPIDGTPVMLYMPTTTNKFAVGQWHGNSNSIIGNWGDDEGNYFTHTPVSFMALSNLERIANPQAAVKESLTLEQAQQAQGVPAGWRLAKVSDGDIRVYGPDKETWLIRNDCGEGFYEFIHRFFDAMLSATPKAGQDK